MPDFIDIVLLLKSFTVSGPLGLWGSTLYIWEYSSAQLAGVRDVASAIIFHEQTQ